MVFGIVKDDDRAWRTVGDELPLIPLHEVVCILLLVVVSCSSFFSKDQLCICNPFLFPSCVKYDRSNTFPEGTRRPSLPGADPGFSPGTGAVCQVR